MKKFLLSVLAIVTVGCQKDYYLDDLQDAEREIAQLESIRQSQQELIQDLQGNLEEANDQIVSLEHTVAEVNYENNLLNLNVDLLKFVVAQREFTIDSLLNVTAQQSATIAIHEETIRDLNDEIVSLNTALTEANELATQQAARIVELENQPPVYIYVTRVVTRTETRWRTQYIAQGDVTTTYNITYGGNYDNFTNRGYVTERLEIDTQAVTTNGSTFTVYARVRPKNSQRWRIGADMPQAVSDASNWLVKSSLASVTITVKSVDFQQSSLDDFPDNAVLELEVTTPVNAPVNNDLTISIRDRIVNSSNPAINFPGLLEAIPSFTQQFRYEPLPGTWALPYSAGGSNNSVSNANPGQTVSLEFVVVPITNRSWRSTYTSADFENTDNWTIELEDTVNSYSETTINIQTISYEASGSVPSADLSNVPLVRFNVEVTLGPWAHGGSSNINTLKIKVKDSVPNGGAGLFE